MNFVKYLASIFCCFHFPTFSFKNRWGFITDDNVIFCVLNAQSLAQPFTGKGHKFEENFRPSQQLFPANLKTAFVNEVRLFFFLTLFQLRSCYQVKAETLKSVILLQRRKISELILVYCWKHWHEKLNFKAISTTSILLSTDCSK